MRGASLAIWLACAGIAGAQDLPALHDVAGVAANDVLNVREAPDAGSAIVGMLAPDAREVEVVALSEGGDWGRVNAGERSGWASMRYLMRRPGSWLDGAPLVCRGTEPFWSLQIDGAEAVYQSPEVAGQSVAVLSRRGSANAPGVVGIALDDGFAVVRQAACSDGMSDRAYGLAVDLFLDGPGGLSGCCSLR